MKIYNRKSFVEGILVLALGILLFMMDLIQHTIEIKGIVLILALCAMGIGLLIRSCSRKYAKEYKLEKQDERNQLIAQKSKSKSFQLTQMLCFLLMPCMLVMGKLSGNTGFIAIGVGLGFAFAISMFTELFTYLYYESKN